MVIFLLTDWIPILCSTTLCCTLLYMIIVLVYPIIFPTIITYPWSTVEDNEKERLLFSYPNKKKNDYNKKQRDKEKKQTIVFAGSFNPPHNGHLAMLLYLSERFGNVIVVVGMNPNKVYPVSPHERANLVRRMIEDTSASKNVSVKVVAGYIWRTVKPMGTKIFVRGIRSWEKDGADERNLQILNTWGPLVLGPLWWPIPTIFLEGKPEYNHVSSTLIRNLCTTISNQRSVQKDDDDSNNLSKSELAQLVPSCIVEDVARLYCR